MVRSPPANERAIMPSKSQQVDTQKMYVTRGDVRKGVETLTSKEQRQTDDYKKMILMTGQHGARGGADWFVKAWQESKMILRDTVSVSYTHLDVYKRQLSLSLSLCLVKPFFYSEDT